MKLGFILHGVGLTNNDWRHPERNVLASTDIDLYLRQARLAELGKFDFLIVADSLSVAEETRPHYLSRFEPVTVLSAIAAITSHIGLVATISTTYSEPFNVARQIASLDHISGGRAGWNVVTTVSETTSDLFSRGKHPPREERYAKAEEFLAVVRGLWDTWNHGAIVGDKASGLFIDPTKVRPLHHVGKHFEIKGQLNIHRLTQGDPVIFQAGSSELGRELGASKADVVYSPSDNFDDAVRFYKDMKGRAASWGRDPDDLSIVVGIRPIIAETRDRAERKYDELAALEPIQPALLDLSFCFPKTDFANADMDAQLIDILGSAYENYSDTAKEIIRMTDGGSMTLGKVMRLLTAPRSPFFGSPDDVCSELGKWIDQQAADGFIIFETLPHQLDSFVSLVIPKLQERGRVRRTYEKGHFRGNNKAN